MLDAMLDLLAGWSNRRTDRRARSPRNFGLSVDDGLPDRGKRYGGAQTIHNTGTVDVVIQDGQVVEVWFRCMQLSAHVSVRDSLNSPLRSYDVTGQPLVAVELAS